MTVFKSEINCPICLTSEKKVISKIGRDFKKLTTVICTGCGLIHSYPIPSELELKEFYEYQYRKSYKSTVKPKLKHIFRYAPHAISRIKYIKKYLKPHQNNLLDIGSGSGEFLYMAIKSGFVAKGIEPNIGYADYSKKYLNLPVINKNFDNTELTERSYDIVNLQDVLEHIPNPLFCLSFINKILKEDGILLIFKSNNFDICSDVGVFNSNILHTFINSFIFLSFLILYYYSIRIIIITLLTKSQNFFFEDW